MSLLTQFSQNIFSSLFGKKKISSQEGTREIGSVEDTNSDCSIPSFSILNRPNKNEHNYIHSSTLSQRENIFFGKDFESNDTNEIIDYNLKKLRNHHDDVITTCIDASGELINTKSSENENGQTDLKIKTKTNGSPSINVTLTNIKTDDDESDNESNDSDSSLSTDTNSSAEIKFDSDDDADDDSDDDSNNTNVNSTEKSYLYLNNNSHEKLQQQQPQKNKVISKHNSIDDIILEDLDMDKLIYNVPPPFIKISNINPMDTIPLKRFNDSISMPANLTKFSTSALGQSYISRSNILSRSLGTQDSSNAIPGIKTIELKKLDSNSKLSVPLSSSLRRSGIPLSNNFSPKELSAPLSTSLLAIQYEQPSFASLISGENNTHEEVSDTEPSYYPIIEEEGEDEEYDIFSYDL